VHKIYKKLVQITNLQQQTLVTIFGLADFLNMNNNKAARGHCTHNTHTIKELSIKNPFHINLTTGKRTHV